jgi:hypothetical protein
MHFKWYLFADLHAFILKIEAPFSSETFVLINQNTQLKILMYAIRIIHNRKQNSRVKVKSASHCALKLVYSQCSFSSRLPRDVIERARMNSSNSMEPSWEQERHKSMLCHCRCETQRRSECPNVSCKVRYACFGIPHSSEFIAGKVRNKNQEP